MSFSLELRSLLFTNGKNIILDNIDFVAEPGNIVLFGGQSGQGKSAFLEICAGILKAQKGKVFWNGDDITSASKYELYERRRSIGYVFQVHALIANHSVFDNIALPLKCGGSLRSAKIRDMVYETMDEFGIPRDIEKKFPETLTVAQQKCVSIARALVNKPKLLLMDEPLAGVDPVTSKSVVGALYNRWKRDGMTVIMATNILSAQLVQNAKSFMLENGKLNLVQAAHGAVHTEENNNAE